LGKSVKILAALLFICCASVGHAQSNSHVDGHVPAPTDFTKFLVRDAGGYLSKKEGQMLAAEFELLREAPTQPGVSYPKFYAWVRGVDDQKKVVVEGAMRLAAIDKKRFEVTDFMAKTEILASPDQLERVFPRMLIPKIKEKAGVK
jgi:hypothetical protein